MEGKLSAALLELTQQQLAAKQLQVRGLQFEAQLLKSLKEGDEARVQAETVTREMIQVKEALHSADRLLLTARALCTKRDEQLELCVFQVGTLEKEFNVAKMDLLAAREAGAGAHVEVVRQRQEIVRLQQEADKWSALNIKIQANVALSQGRAEQAEAKFKAMEGTLDLARADIERLYLEKEALEKNFGADTTLALQLEKQLGVNKAINQKVIELSEQLEWNQKAHDEVVQKLVLTNHDLSTKEGVLLQTNNEMQALTLQLQTVTQALDHAVEANEHLKSETSTLTTDLASLTRLHEEASGGLTARLLQKEQALALREQQLHLKESEVGLLRVSVAQALNDTYVAQQTADSKDEEAAAARLELLKVRSSTWEDRGAVSLAPTPRDTDNVSVDSFQSGPNTNNQRTPRYGYKKGLF